MKKRYLLIIFILSTVHLVKAQFTMPGGSQGINATYFVGGSLGFSTSGSATVSDSITVDGTSKLGFNISPEVGYIYSEKIWFGLQIGYDISRSKTPVTTESEAAPGVFIPTTIVTTSTSGTFYISPYVRYYAVNFDKLYIGFDNALRFSTSFGKDQTGDGDAVKQPRKTSFYLGITPGLYYQVSDRIMLETRINLLSLSYNRTSTKSEGSSVKGVSQSFGFGFNSTNIVNVGDINIGAVFLF